MKEGMKRNQKYINYLLYLQSFLPSSSIYIQVNPFHHGFCSLLLISLFPFSIFHSSLFPPSSCSVLPFFFYFVLVFLLCHFSFYNRCSYSLCPLAFHSYGIYLQKSFVQFWLEKTEWPQVLLFMRSRKNIKHMHNSKQVHFAELGLPTLSNIFAWISSFSRQVVTQFCLRIDQQRATWTYY